MRKRAEAPSSPFPVRLSPAERATVKRAAAINHQKPSQFVRDAVVTAAEECLEMPRRRRPRVVRLELEP